VWRSLTRDTAIVSFAIAMGTYEIVLGGARPVVLTFLAALFASPIPLRLDEARRARKEGEEKGQ
jgi:uncharacterized membrane protein